MITGLGETGAALARSGVNKIAFTGSGPTARKVMAVCAESLTPLVAECGGKDAMIVAADADLDKAVQFAAFGAFGNAGQTCAGVERVYVSSRSTSSSWTSSSRPSSGRSRAAPTIRRTAR